MDDFSKGKFERLKGKEKLEFDEDTGLYKCPEPLRIGKSPSGGRRTKDFFYHASLNAFRAKKGSVKYVETAPKLFGKHLIHLPIHAFSITIALKKVSFLFQRCRDPFI